MVATIGMLDRNGVIQYVGQNASRFGLDPAAVLAVANHEGLNTAPGSSWKLPGENNISFGPPSWFGGGAGSTLLTQFGSDAPKWAWSPAGLDYWLQSVANAGAQGLSGLSAITAIVNNFERPREDLRQGEISNAENDYTKMQAAIGVPVTPIPTQTPGQGTITLQPGGTTTPAPATPTGGVNAGSLGPFPINLPSGLILALIGIVLLIVGAMLFGFNVQNQVTAKATDLLAERT